MAVTEARPKSVSVHKAVVLAVALASTREERVDALDEGNLGPFELAGIALS